VSTDAVPTPPGEHDGPADTADPGLRALRDKAARIAIELAGLAQRLDDLQQQITAHHHPTA
jgi:hypothetical protein